MSTAQKNEDFDHPGQSGFTHARPTFYRPRFCFDSESFRYLVSLKNEIDCNNDEQKREYEMSWSTSTSLRESNRLVNYVATQLQIYSSYNQWQSVKNMKTI
jgi:hypothetical protein